MALWLLAVGLISMLGQVVLLRELLVTFFGSELIYLLALGFLLPGTALGALLGRRLGRPSAAQVRGLLLAAAPVLPALVVLARALRVVFRGTPGAYLAFPQQLLGLALVVLPFGVLLGLLFHRSAALYVSGGRTLARAYAIESAGGLVGGALVTLLTAWGVQNLAAGLLGGMAAAVAAGVRVEDAAPEGPPRRWLLSPPRMMGVLLAALLLLALRASPRLDLQLTRLNHPDLAASRETPYGRVTITRSQGQVTVFENDALSWESQGTSAEEFVHLAALEAPEPRSVLLLGGGAEGLTREVVKHHPDRVLDVDLDGTLLDMLKAFVPEELTPQPARPPEVTRSVPRPSWDGPETSRVIADSRRFLARAGVCDLILVGMPEPASGQANRFYTREFFEDCRRHLSPEGVLGLRLRSAENLWTPALARRNASIHRALKSVFADVLVLPGTTNVLIASRAPLARDPAVLVARWEQRGAQARLVSPAWLRYQLTNDRVGEIAGVLERTRAPVNTDTRPICYQYTLILWLSRFFPVIGMLDLPGPGPGQWSWLEMGAAAVALLAVLLFARRRRAPCRRALLVAAVGFIGMVLEGALILGYQVRRGVLFQDLGLLLTAFMAGLWLGSLLLDRLAGGAASRTGAGPGRTAGVALLGGTAALSLLAAFVLFAGGGAGLPATFLLLLAAGFLVGGVFAWVSLQGGRDQAAVISPLYAADLLGGCVGSLAAGLFLLPVLGLPGSGILVAAVALMSLLLV